MAKKATGSELEWIDGTARTRIRVCGKRETFRFPTCRTPETAAARRAQLVELEGRMQHVDRELALAALQRVARAPEGQTLKVACTIVDKLIGGWRPTSQCMTLGELAALWFSGELAKRYPGDVRERKSIGPARANLEKYVLPDLGTVPLDSITLDACDAIKYKLGHLRSNSRRQVLAPLKTLLDYAVHPLRLIERSPLPAKWLPKEGDTRELQWLYPHEDAQLMACTAVPLWQRVLFGYLIREGGRESEPLAQTVDQFDLVLGKASLTKAQTKTKKVRFWALDAGTARALCAWVAARNAKPSDCMFVTETGARINPKTIDLPELLRAGLKLAGVTRRELHETTTESRNLVVHDLRRSFVTVKLGLGWSEAEISRRTGHITSEELRGYEESAKTFAELNVGDFEPLDAAIPELAAFGQRLTSAIAKPAQLQDSRDSIVELHPAAQAPVTTELQEISPVASPVQSPAADVGGHSQAVRLLAIEAELQALRMVLQQQPAQLAAALVSALEARQPHPAG